MKIKALYIIPFNKKHIFRNLVNWTIVCPHTPPLPHPNQTVSEYSVGMFLLVLVFTVWMLSQLFEMFVFLIKGWNVSENLILNAYVLLHVFYC